jgi:geranylgeranylglycerol-phosphate geranylgeranyltransferase
MGGFLALLRPGNGVVAAAAVFTGGIVALGTSPEPAPRIGILLGAPIAFMFTGAGNALNDYLDREIDKKAHPERPIPSGQVSPGSALGTSVALFGAALALSAFVSWMALAFVAALVGLMLAYEWRLKAAGFVGNIAIGVLSGVTFAFGGLAVNNVEPTLSLAGVGVVASVGREVAKDIQDMASDEGRRTLPQRVGAARASEASAFATLIAIGLSPLPFFFAPLGAVYLPLIAVADATFFYAAVVVRDEPRRSQQLSKIGMAIATLAFALGGWFR